MKSVEENRGWYIYIFHMTHILDTALGVWLGLYMLAFNIIVIVVSFDIIVIFYMHLEGARTL